MARVLSKPNVEFAIEALAVLGSLLYTFRYLNGKPDAFFFGALGAACFVWLCYRRKIYAESFLQLFYVGLAVYGYLNLGEEWREESRPLTVHLIACALATVATVGLGILLQRYSESRLPFMDAFTTVFSLWAAWLMVHFVHENWLYWIVIDLVAIVLYAARRMYLGAALFLLYALMAIAGFWRLDWFSL